MTDTELKEAVITSVREVMQEINSSRTQCDICVFDPVQHRAEHEALRKVINFFDHMEEVRWGMLRKIMIVFILTFLTLLAYGFRGLLVFWTLNPGGP